MLPIGGNVKVELSPVVIKKHIVVSPVVFQKGLPCGCGAVEPVEEDVFLLNDGRCLGGEDDGRFLAQPVTALNVLVGGLYLRQQLQVGRRGRLGRCMGAGAEAADYQREEKYRENVFHGMKGFGTL